MMHLGETEHWVDFKSDVILITWLWFFTVAKIKINFNLIMLAVIHDGGDNIAFISVDDDSTNKAMNQMKIEAVWLAQT